MKGLGLYKSSEEDIIFNNIYKQSEFNSRIQEAEVFGRMKMSVDIGLRLIELGVEDKIIMEATGLSLVDIESLKN